MPAKSLIAAGLAQRVLVQLSYAIGVAEPLSIFVDSYATGLVPDSELVEIINKTWDVRPAFLRTDLISAAPSGCRCQGARPSAPDLLGDSLLWPLCVECDLRDRHLPLVCVTSLTHPSRSPRVQLGKAEAVAADGRGEDRAQEGVIAFDRPQNRSSSHSASSRRLNARHTDTPTLRTMPALSWAPRLAASCHLANALQPCAHPSSQSCAACLPPSTTR